ncbi:MAG: acetylxylan esterase [Planctomycetota bacterium]|nr:acetylxylan esterase [Planctomycetota bacterium]
MRKVQKHPAVPERLVVEHSLPFDPTCGYDLPALLAIEPPPDVPDDYEAFWRETYARARELDGRLRVERRTLERTPSGVELQELEYDTWDGFRSGGWLARPASDAPRGLIVQGHGYGGREGCDLSWALRGYAVLQPCAIGFHRSACAAVPNLSSGHVLCGIESKERYILRACTAQLWHAASVLQELFPDLKERLFYDGGSFGGGLGAFMLAWDRRYKAATLGVPTFGHHPIRLRFPCSGSGESVRLYGLKRPGVIEVLRYYDASTAATFITCPVMASVALFDPAVIPPGQFSVANALRNPDSVTCVISHGHYEVPHKVIAPEVAAAMARMPVEWLVELGCQAGEDATA